MANLYEFQRNYRKTKKQKGNVAQINVAQNKGKVLRCRVDIKTFERFIERCELKEMDQSKLLRTMVEYCLDKVEKTTWEKEVENWE